MPRVAVGKAALDLVGRQGREIPGRFSGSPGEARRGEVHAREIGVTS